MHCFTRWILASFIFAAAASAAMSSTVITFEDLIAPGRGSGGLTVNNQYAAFGVTIANASAFDDSKGGSFAIPGFSHSGVVSVEACFAAEFCTSPVTVNFTAGQARVKAWVGLTYNAVSASIVEMRGYNSGGVQITSTTVTLPARPSAPTLIRFPLEIGRFAGDIRKVDIGMAPVGTGFNGGLAVDDIEFDTIGPAPPCPAVIPPTLGIVKPVSGLVTRCNRFLFQDNVITGDPFARRTITVIGPTMGQRSSWTSQASTGVSSSIWLYGALFPGANTIIDRIEDCRGAVEKSATVTYNPIPAGTGIEVLGFEPTQAVQRMPTSVPLITSKRTVVRVYLRLEGPLASLPGISGRLSAFMPGVNPQYELGPAIPPFNVQSLNTITVLPTTNLLSARRDINVSLNFEIPASWTEVGKVHFTLTGVMLEGCDTRLDLSGGDNRLAFGNFSYNTFSAAPPVRLRVVSVPYRTSAAGTVFTPREKDLNLLESWLGRAYPTASVISSRTTLATRTGTPDSTFNSDDINSQLQDLRSMETSNGSVDDRTHYYGLVHDGGGFMRGKADGIPSRVACGPTGSNSFGWDSDGSYGDWYGGHELGHTFGRFHAKWCGAEECFDFIWTFCPGGYVPYPFLGGVLDSEITYGNYGFDVGDPSLSVPRAVLRPETNHDVMTYCASEWVSDFTYNGILSRLRAENPSGDIRARRSPIAEGLMLSAKMNLTQETAQLRPFWRMPNLDATERPTVSHYSIHLRDAAGNDLAVYLFDPKVDTEAVTGEDLKASLSEVVPWVAGTRRIVIMRDEVELISRTVSTNTPVVLILAPNGGENLNGPTALVSWQASDADVQPLTYVLQYSKDAGSTWQVVDSGIQTTSYTVNLDAIPGSATALFRVYATDGVNTGVDTSNATFIVRTKPPTAKIISPGNNTNVTSADTVVFTGKASDIEDGELSGSALQWSSNVQGALGSGSSVSVNLLPGTHTITLTATDSSTATGPAAITVVVSAAAPAPSAGADRYAVTGVSVPFDGSASSGVPTLTFLWEIVSRPDGSTAAISNPATTTPAFTPDHAGTYIVQLTITDGTGVSAVVRVNVIATSAVRALQIAGGLAGSTAADMTAMNVEAGGPSAGRIDIADAVRLARRALLDRDGGGVVTVTNSNQYGSIVIGKGYGVYIDDPRLNGSPDQRVIACHQFVGSYNQEIGVWYSAAAQKWVVYNEDRSVMQVGEKINYAFGPNIGAVTRGATSGPWPWGVYLDDPRINFNPNAIVLSTHNYVGNYGEPLGVWFNGAKWVAYHETGGNIPSVERYFWVDAGAAGGRVHRSAGTAYSSYGLYLNDARIDGDSSAIVIAQHDGQNVYNKSPMGVWYDGSRWVVYNEDISPLTNGEAVHYIIVQR